MNHWPESRLPQSRVHFWMQVMNFVTKIKGLQPKIYQKGDQMVIFNLYFSTYTVKFSIKFYVFLFIVKA